jgi:hypothetical protein
VGVPLAVLGAVRAVSWAASSLKSWNQGETLSAADLNGNFTAIDQRLATLEGAQIPASRLSGIGDIVASLLAEAQFQAARGQGWVLADGRSAAGSMYQTVTGQSAIPDLRGVFLRGRNDGGSAAGVRNDGKQNPDPILPLGGYQADMFASHNHGSTLVLDLAGSHSYQAGPYAINPTDSPAAGGNETRPKNVTVNFFVRIN